MSHLNEKRGELKEVMDKLQNLNDDYRSKVNKKEVIVNYKQNYEKLQVMAMMAWLLGFSTTLSVLEKYYQIK